MRHKYVLKITLSGFIAIFLAVSPILDPYILTEIGSGITIRVNDVLAIILAAGCILSHGSLKNKKGYMMLLCLIIGFCNLLSWVAYPNGAIVNQIKVIIIWTVYMLLATFLWDNCEQDRFFSIAEKIAIFAAIVVILQFIFGNLGVSVWDGRLSFLQLSKYDNWSGYIDPNTGSIRPNGIFQESSYVGIYFLILYAHSLMNEKLRNAVVYLGIMILSSSLVAVMSAAMISVYFFLNIRKNDISLKTRRRIILVVALVVIIGIYVYSTNIAIRNTLDYIIRRITNISSDLRGTRLGSTKQRLIGQLPLFTRYSTVQKIFGTGALQYISMFSAQAYSNNYVNFILYYGINGIILFCLWLVGLYRKIDGKNKIYFWCMIIIFGVDQQWFSWYFLYLMGACVLVNYNSTETKGDIKQ